MNLKEMLAAKLKEFEAAETIEDAKRIKAEIDELQAKIALAEQKQGMLAAMNAAAPVHKSAGGAHKPRTLGEKAVADVKAADTSERFSVTVKAGDGDSTAATPADPVVNTVPATYAPAITEVRPDVLPGARRPLTIVDLFDDEPTEKDSITYFVETAATGSPAAIGENGLYPEIKFGEPAAHTDSLKKIGCVYRESDELLSDAPRLAKSIDGRAQYMMDIRKEDQVMSGDGTGNNVKGLLNTSGLQTAKATSYDAAIDLVKTAKVSIKKNTPGFRADAIVLNDEDWDVLTSIKDKNGQYLAGGPFTGQYGNGQFAEEAPMWGLKMVPSQAVPKNTIIVGAFKMGGSYVHKGGRQVDITNSDGDDFSNGRIAVRPSERGTLAVRYPAAFVKITIEIPAKTE